MIAAGPRGQPPWCVCDWAVFYDCSSHWINIIAMLNLTFQFRSFESPNKLYEYLVSVVAGNRASTLSDAAGLSADNTFSDRSSGTHGNGGVPSGGGEGTPTVLIMFAILCIKVECCNRFASDRSLLSEWFLFICWQTHQCVSSETVPSPRLNMRIKWQLVDSGNSNLGRRLQSNSNIKIWFRTIVLADTVIWLFVTWRVYSLSHGRLFLQTLSLRNVLIYSTLFTT